MWPFLKFYPKVISPPLHYLDVLFKFMQILLYGLKHIMMVGRQKSNRSELTYSESIGDDVFKLNSVLMFNSIASLWCFTKEKKIAQSENIVNCKIVFLLPFLDGFECPSQTTEFIFGKYVESTCLKLWEYWNTVLYCSAQFLPSEVLISGIAL